MKSTVMTLMIFVLVGSCSFVAPKTGVPPCPPGKLKASYPCATTTVVLPSVKGSNG